MTTTNFKVVCEETGWAKYSIMEVTDVETKKDYHGCERTTYYGNIIRELSIPWEQIMDIVKQFGAENLMGSFRGCGNMNWSMPEGMESALIAAEDAYVQEQKRAEAESAIAACELIIEKFERQTYKPDTIKEVIKYRRNYIRTMNEGGYGFVPTYYSREEVDAAKARLEKIRMSMAC